MRLLEFQAKRLFAEYGLPIPRNIVLTDPDRAAALEAPVILKAQVPVGGRGKAGAVRRVDDPSRIRDQVARLLDMDIKGYPVSAVLAEQPVEFEREVYLAYLVDKRVNRPLILASSRGGVDIEEVSRKNPEDIFERYVHPSPGPADYDIRALAKALDLPDPSNLGPLVRGMIRLYDEQEATLVEINPLAVTPDGLVALDAKITLDDKAAFRHQESREVLAEESTGLDRRRKTRSQDLAEALGIQYVPLDGTVGLIADGAGTGMLTLDMILDLGGRPADFCELGGLADTRVMTGAMAAVLADERIEVLIISLIGGLTRMDEMARGIVAYLEGDGRRVPLAVRMCGTKAEAGIPLLAEAGVRAHEDLAEAVRAGLALAGGA